MNPGGVLVLLVLLALLVATLVVTLRGGRGPADPPRSHPGAGWPAPRGVLHRRGAAPARTPRRPVTLHRLRPVRH
ncbi:hypothetical protein [Klenkia taihuensis]|uniref:Uncharacterized protein n=1 Tax=Klenkia taihuensis TaxID=1225127 RepID=A0A1I1NK42_9ACTN|nr:hypothetical protein [Klenkia taihuensis]SFC95093.1 hypothetical protein SAMN05661030_2059 [Klenkia taihuensis]